MSGCSEDHLHDALAALDLERPSPSARWRSHGELPPAYGPTCPLARHSACNHAVRHTRHSVASRAQRMTLADGRRDASETRSAHAEGIADADSTLAGCSADPSAYEYFTSVLRTRRFGRASRHNGERRAEQPCESLARPLRLWHRRQWRSEHPFRDGLRPLADEKPSAAGASYSRDVRDEHGVQYLVQGTRERIEVRWSPVPDHQGSGTRNGLGLAHTATHAGPRPPVR